MQKKDALSGHLTVESLDVGDELELHAPRHRGALENFVAAIGEHRRAPQGVEERFMTVETISLRDLDALVADGMLKDETTVLGLYMARVRLAAAGLTA